MAQKKQVFSKLRWSAFQFRGPQHRAAFYGFFRILIGSLNFVPLFALDRGVSLSAIKMSSFMSLPLQTQTVPLSAGKRERTYYWSHWFCFTSDWLI